jgi:hypothetical protein
VRRRLRYRGGQHVDGVYDRLNWSFANYIVTYRREMRPRVLSAIDRHGRHARLLQFTSRAEAAQFLCHEVPGRVAFDLRSAA